MPYRPQHHCRRSLRLPGYDYTQPGAYFVTVCVRGAAGLLGQVADGTVALSDWGQVAAESWAWLEEQYPYVTLDAWVVMPNHLHGILIITDDPGHGRGRSRTAPTTPTATMVPTATTNGGTPKRKPLGRLIGAFKTVSTKRINQMRGTPGSPFWQRGFCEHIVRDENDLAAMPFEWATCPLNQRSLPLLIGLGSGPGLRAPTEGAEGATAQGHREP